MNKGILYAVGAYLLWGFIPVYFKLLNGVPAAQVMTHRVVWSFVFVFLLIVLRKEFTALRTLLTRRILFTYLAAGVLLSANWLLYVWAVNAGLVVEGSLGYFINPLLSVLLALVFLRERLRTWQWLPLALAAVGVLYLTVSYGAVPWVALALAGTFGLYGLIKKIAPLDALQGLTLETAAVFVPALGYLLFEESTGNGAFGHAGLLTTLLLALCGVVTAVPLLLYAAALRHTPLSVMGFLQYISPTIQFLVGVFLYGEPFTPQRAIGFSFIWLALIILSAEGYLHQRRIACAAHPA